jgi:hypothetical protein
LENSRVLSFRPTEREFQYLASVKKDCGAASTAQALRLLLSECARRNMGFDGYPATGREEPAYGGAGFGLGLPASNTFRPAGGRPERENPLDYCVRVIREQQEQISVLQSITMQQLSLITHQRQQIGLLQEQVFTAANQPAPFFALPNKAQDFDPLQFLSEKTSELMRLRSALKSLHG